MHLLLAPLSSPEDEGVLDNEVEAFSKSLAKVGNCKASASAVNVGLGADWMVIGVQVTAWFGAVLLLPELHKRIRESIEECRRMHQEVTAIMQAVAGGRQILSLPTEVLYLRALERVLSECREGSVALVALDSLPVPSELSHGTDLPSHYLFAFQVHEQIVLVAIASTGEVLWSKTLTLGVA